MSYRAGFLGLIGQPNAGKSTLMNYLVNEKVSIVTPKPQTTRRRILGIANTDEGQIVFVDAPGVINAAEGLNGFLAKEALDVIASSDALVAVLSLDENHSENAQKTIDMVADSGKPWIGVITKVDLEAKIHRIMILRKMIEMRNGKVLTISVTKAEKNNDERQTLLKEFMELLPESPAPLYDTELFTNESVRDMAAEIVREKCFEILHHEIPYSIAVRIAKFEEDAKPCPKIYAEIIVAKDSHKPIVIGKDASIIKSIGIGARKEIEKLMGGKVFLDLTVACRDNWYDNKGIMKELHYVADSKK